MTPVSRSIPRLAGALALFALTLAGCARSTRPTPAVVVPLSSLTIAPHADTLSIGGRRQLTATAYDTLGVLVGSPAITWTSSDNGIATVSGNGVVTAQGEGGVWIYASSGGQRDSSHTLVIGDAGWVLQTSGTTNNLAAIVFRPSGRMGWAVGTGGRVVHTIDAGQTWAIQNSGTAFNLNGVAFPTDLGGVAVGNAGTVVTTTDGGAHWSRNLSVSASENLMDVTFVDAGHGWAVGSNGAVFRTTDGGASWTKRLLGTTFTLRSVAFAGLLDGWTAGDGGAVFGTHDGGVSWYPLTIGTSQPLHGMSRWDTAHTLAVGQAGTVAVALAGPDSVVWSLPNPNAGANNQLEKCVLVNATTGFAVGFNASVGGIVLLTADGGTTWQSQVSNTMVHLNGVSFVDGIRGWAVGDGGTILHTGNGGVAP